MIFKLNLKDLEGFSVLYNDDSICGNNNYKTTKIIRRHIYCTPGSVSGHFYVKSFSSLKVFF